MSTDNKKIEKHIGEQVPLSLNNQDADTQNPRNKPDNNQENSNQGTSNPLKPQETQKGVDGKDIKK